jgi:long-chain acyl-CoA synthetase
VNAETTFPKLLAALAERHGTRRVALQEKRFGIWQPITWAEYHRRVRRFAHGLAALGFRRGEVLAILGDNRPEWVIAELASQALGGMSVGLYPDGVVDEVHHVLEHAEVRIVVAEDQEQVDKLISLRDDDRLPTVEQIVYYDPRGLEHYGVDMLVEFDAVAQMGDELERTRPGWPRCGRSGTSSACPVCAAPTRAARRSAPTCSASSTRSASTSSRSTARRRFAESP